MQAAALCFAPAVFPLPNAQTNKCFLAVASKSLSKYRAKAITLADEVSTVDYSSLTSVFPAEACETIGGDACDVEMYPEAKLPLQATKPNTAQETLERQYIDYSSDLKTVFIEEACDDLGGEFCAPGYRQGAASY